MFELNRITPRSGSSGPGEPTPIPFKSPIAMPASATARRTVATMAARIASAPSSAGVAFLARPSTRFPASTTAASTFVPPRSTPATRGPAIRTAIADAPRSRPAEQRGPSRHGSYPDPSSGASGGRRIAGGGQSHDPKHFTRSSHSRTKKARGKRRLILSPFQRAMRSSA